jgi:hypothetical protein
MSDFDAPFVIQGIKAGLIEEGSGVILPFSS